MILGENQQMEFIFFREFSEEKYGWNHEKENWLMFPGPPVFSKISICIHRLSQLKGIR